MMKSSLSPFYLVEPSLTGDLAGFIRLVVVFSRGFTALYRISLSLSLSLSLTRVSMCVCVCVYWLPKTRFRLDFQRALLLRSALAWVGRNVVVFVIFFFNALFVS